MFLLNYYYQKAVNVSSDSVFCELFVDDCWKPQGGADTGVCCVRRMRCALHTFLKFCTGSPVSRFWALEMDPQSISYMKLLLLSLVVCRPTFSACL